MPQDKSVYLHNELDWGSISKGTERNLFQNVRKVALGPNSCLMNSGDSLPINKAATACTNSYPRHVIWCAESSNFSSRHLACTNAHNKRAHTCSFSMRNKMCQVHLLVTTKNCNCCRDDFQKHLISCTQFPSN